MPSAPGRGAEEAAMARKEAAAVTRTPKRAERESAMSRPFERAVDQTDTPDSALSRSGMCMTLPTRHALLLC
ncbi:hypothetical protein GCM10022207_68520 [Streptomyces lannensis]|uniref:Uncharacterized protein n=1 Tax=Streptomyces lannensis TaxID=766498 RepID=A0ABP7KYP2_9ACTN